MKSLPFLLLAALLGRLPLSVRAATDLFLTVGTANGFVEGSSEAGAVRVFKGIPYAEPPVGELRWREPRPSANWTGILHADHFGPRPMQPTLWKDMIFRSERMSEDCLYLNVWTPAKSVAGHLPVLVYFHGGGLIAGDGSEARYDGASMARKGIVMVTVNYRLGIFGFYSHPELSRESAHHSSGNYGFQDQVKALRWVQKNIAAFGGDPGRVTIGGQSAGATSVSSLMASPLAKGLFVGAIGESGSILGSSPPLTLADAERDGLAFASKAGASSLAALREIPAEALLGKSDGMKFGRIEIVDGYFFPETPEEIYFTGKQADVPLLAGWNSAEVSYEGVLGHDAPTPENYGAALHKLYGKRFREAQALYPVWTTADVEHAATDLASDRYSGYRTWKWIDAHWKSGGKPVFRYFYCQPLPRAKGPTGGASATRYWGATHSAEIPYALGNLALVDAYPWSRNDFRTSEVMQGYFANFIKTGNPNGPDLPKWTWMQASTPEVMIIAPESHLTPEPNSKRYLFLDSL